MKKMLIMAVACLMAAMTFAAQCAATTKKGTQCKRQASPGSQYCWQHSAEMDRPHWWRRIGGVVMVMQQKDKAIRSATCIR